MSESNFRIALVVIGLLFVGVKSHNDDRLAVAAERLADVYAPAISTPTIGNLLPDSTRTPGKINPKMTKEILCSKGFTTKSVRPPAKYTSALKRQQMKEWKLLGKPQDYEEDHLISLELGGCPDCSENLWPEAYLPEPGARQKDKVENWLHKQVCYGNISLSVAQSMISHNWYKVYLSMPKESR